LTASGAVTAQTPPPAAPAKPARPTPPQRDPHTVGYVEAVELANEAVPAPNKNGNFIVGPAHNPAPEVATQEGVPHGMVYTFTMNSEDSKIFPGIARDPASAQSLADRLTRTITTHPAPYMRKVAVYVPQQYKSGTEAPLMIGADGPDQLLFTTLDNLIAEKKVPVMIAVSIANGGSDGQGSERGLEYDTMSGKYAEFVEHEVLPMVEQQSSVKLTKDPNRRATMGCSSGAAAAMSMAWYHNDLYHRVVSYSGTYVNQQWPRNPETAGGAWEYHRSIIPNSPKKPLRIWMQVSDRDLLNTTDDMHDWVLANENMAKVLAQKGYHYQFLFTRNAGHCDGGVRRQTLAEALEYVWQGYPKLP
jgi:iron(III)-enterobactin esterase